jgi:5-methylcytosine-specific restriction endonuclease McrA
MIDRSKKRGDPFYLSKPWKVLRLKALRRDRYMCQKCGIACIGKARNAPSPHVDHIVPRTELYAPPATLASQWQTSTEIINPRLESTVIR